MNLTDLIVGISVFVFAIAYFIHELRWVNSQLRGRLWGNEEDNE